MRRAAVAASPRAPAKGRRASTGARPRTASASHRARPWTAASRETARGSSSCGGAAMRPVPASPRWVSRRTAESPSRAPSSAMTRTTPPGTTRHQRASSEATGSTRTAPPRTDTAERKGVGAPARKRPGVPVGSGRSAPNWTRAKDGSPAARGARGPARVSRVGAAAARSISVAVRTRASAMGSMSNTGSPARICQTSPTRAVRRASSRAWRATAVGAPRGSWVTSTSAPRTARSRRSGMQRSSHVGAGARGVSIASARSRRRASAGWYARRAPSAPRRQVTTAWKRACSARVARAEARLRHVSTP